MGVDCWPSAVQYLVFIIQILLPSQSSNRQAASEETASRHGHDHRHKVGVEHLQLHVDPHNGRHAVRVSKSRLHSTDYPHHFIVLSPCRFIYDIRALA